MRELSRVGIATVIIALLTISAALGAGQLSAGQALDANYVTVHNGLTGMTWDGKEFIGTYGINDVPLVNISLDGQKVTHFAPSFIGKDECYAAVSEGKAGFPQGYLYVNNETAIYKIDPAGSSVQVFSSPPGAHRIAYVAFDTVGAWGDVLFALDDNGMLWSFTSDGTATVLGNFSSFASAQSDKVGGLKPEGIAVAPQSFGALGGYLFITLEGAGRILAIPPKNPGNVTTLVQLPGEEPERIMQIPPASDLYVAEFDSGARLRIPAANFTNYVGSMLVITEGENEPFGSLTVLQPSGANVTTTRIGTVTGHPHFEGASWVPANAVTQTLTTPQSQSASNSTTTTSQSASESTTSGGISSGVLVGGGALLVAVVVATALLISRRARTSRPGSAGSAHP